MPLNNRYSDQVALVIDTLNLIDWETSNFALKGGTAINLFYENYPRASVDIDLVYLPLNDRSTAIQQIRDEMQQLTAKFNKYGLTAIIKHISQDNPVGKIEIGRNRIKIIVEPNTSLRGNLYFPEYKDLCKSAQQIFQKEAVVKCLAYLELYAGKLNAMVDRQHPRDIFDMYLYWRKNKTLKDLMDCFVAYVAQNSRPFSELLEPNELDIAKIYETDFIGMTEEKVSLDVLIDFRKMLFAEIKKALTKQQKEFLFSLMQNKPDWSLLLFPYLKDMPAIQWKMQNIAKMPADKSKAEIRKLEKIFL